MGGVEPINGGYWVPLANADMGANPHKEPAAGVYPGEEKAEQLALPLETDTVEITSSWDYTGLPTGPLIPLSWNQHMVLFLGEMTEVLADRGNNYGDRIENFDNIAEGWSVILGVEVTGRQVAKCMTWVKLARDSNKVNHDNMLDGANYLLIADMLP